MMLVLEYCILKYKTVKYEYHILCSSFMLKLYVYYDFIIWKPYLKTFLFFPLLPLLFLPSPSVFPFPPSFLFSLFFMNSSSNTGLHSPCSFHQKRVMFLLRRILFSTHHIPARRKGWLTKPSSGLTWLWLVATAYQAFLQNLMCLIFAFQNILKSCYIVRYVLENWAFCSNFILGHLQAFFNCFQYSFVYQLFGFFLMR